MARMEKDFDWSLKKGPFHVWTRCTPNVPKPLMWMAFAGKTQLIFSFWFIKHVGAFKSSTKFRFQPVMTEKQQNFEKLTVSCFIVRASNQNISRYFTADGKKIVQQCTCIFFFTVFWWRHRWMTSQTPLVSPCVFKIRRIIFADISYFSNSCNSIPFQPCDFLPVPFSFSPRWIVRRSIGNY